MGSCLCYCYYKTGTERVNEGQESGEWRLTSSRRRRGSSGWPSSAPSTSRCSRLASSSTSPTACADPRTSAGTTERGPWSPARRPASAGPSPWSSPAGASTSSSSVSTPRTSGRSPTRSCPVTPCRPGPWCSTSRSSPPPQGDEALRRLRDVVEGLDVGVLVNNAGVMNPGAAFLHEADAEALIRMIRVNLWATTVVTAAVIPGMAARGRGAVVSMGSATSEAVSSFPLHAVYSGTKRYVAVLSGGLAAEYGGRGVDVQCQAPMFVATAMVAAFSALWRPAPLVPTADAYARAAVRWVGRGGPLCVPSLRHRLLWCLLDVVPGCVQDWACLREGLRQRKTSRSRRSSTASACHASN
ncbi:very-long-chain 3-oxoacyl-CoA reductase-like protein At1g24470 isoform X1 [Triticum aestivum]|uniref:very-long-chain 3-oxoacyl-CoA reductase-like protein At1g24470 isoform X1 n=1 Tax=Triticum aestivum TaxID=4565 RepID=UPI001D015182|nr:very-long-chain 3-oxoacyl-CoA reductase-like protein At1g24470 isoform X1 [Triticum aestivum]